MEIYGVGTNKEKNLRVQWEADRNKYTYFEMDNSFIELITKDLDHAETINQDRLNWELRKAINAAVLDAFKLGKDILIGKHNNNLMSYIDETIDMAERTYEMNKDLTYEQHLLDNYDIEVDSLCYKYNVRDEEELMTVISPEDLAELEQYK